MLAKLLAPLALLLALCVPAHAQNTTCATRSPGDKSNACASTAFVNTPATGGSFLPNQPVIGGPSGGLAQGTRSGNSTAFPTVDGTPVNGQCAVFDSFGGLNSVACSPSGSGTVGAGLTNQLAIYPANGTSVVGTSTIPGVTSIPSQEISVLQFGAVGDSNGTHGNGTDDTTAFNNALASATPVSIYVPCGTYRITSQIGSSVTSGQYRLHGAGQCSKIYADFAAANSAVLFHTSTGCTNCLEIDHLNFITPNINAVGMIAIQLFGNFNARIHNNYFAGYDEVLYLEQSYAPQFIDNWANAIRGSLIATPGGTDVSLNNAQIRGNAIFNSGIVDSSASLVLNCGGHLHGQLSVVGNDIELGYAGVLFNSCNAIDFGDNYIENMTTSDFNFAGINSSVHIHDNWFGTAAATTIGPITRGTFEGNEIYGWALTWGSQVLGMQVKPTNILVTGSGASMALSSTVPTLSTCGGGTPAIGSGSNREAGEVFEGTSTTTCTLSFELPYLLQPYCVVSGGGASPIQMTAISVNGLTVQHASGSGLSWFYHCTGQIQ